MHKILRAESRPAVSTGHDCQGSPSLSGQVLPKVSLLNDPLRYGGGLARFAAALLLIAFALPLIPAAEAQTGIGPILFSEDYESYEVGSLPEGYEIVFNGRGTAEQRVEAEGGNRHLRTAGRRSWSLAMRKDFDFDLPGVVSVSWRMRVDNDINDYGYTDAGGARYVHFGDFGLKNTDEVAASLSINKYESDRKIVAYCQEGGGSRPEVQLGVWTEFRMDVDFAAGRYSMYKDGVKFCEQATRMEDLSARWNSWGESSGLRFGSGNNGDSVTLFDDIVVRGGRPPPPSSILFSEDYESYEVGSLPEGYEIVFNGRGTAEQRVEAEGGNRHLRTAGRYRWGLGMHKDFDFDLPEVVSVSWRMRLDNDLDRYEYTDPESGARYASFGSFGLKNTDEVGASLSINKYESDRKIVAYCQEGGGSRPEVQLGVWTEFRMDVDFAAGRYSTYKDGVKFCERATRMEDLSGRWNFWGESSGLRFSSGNSGSGTSVTLFDDIVVRGGRPPSMLSWTITTIAGNGERSFGGDGGPATATQLDRPRGVAVDGAGNLYIADTQNKRIRKVDSTGTITTVAGTGVWGFSGDGGPASEAQLSTPRGVTVDGAGNLYIADSRNHRIRKVDSTGTITTVAGTGVEGFSGDGGPAVEARISFPEGVAVDGAGNLYIGDLYNNRIRKVDSRGTITTIAGTGEGSYSGDGGPASEAQLSTPSGVAVDGAGNLYIGDTYNYRIRKVDSTGTITTIAGTGEDGFSGDGGPATEAHLYAPQSLAVDGAGNLYIGDLYNHRIRKVDSRGTITTIAGTGESGFSGDGGPATEAHLYAPHGVALDGAGNLYIADTINNRIRKLTPMTGPVTLVPVISGGSEWFSISAATPYSLTVEWKEPENTGSAITDYDVRYREVGSGGDFTDARHEGTARTATLTGLRPGTAYEVQVRATNATGTGAWSQLGVVRTSPLQTGDQIYYFPHLAVGASWQTTITYINYSPQQVSCTTEFFSDQGTPLLVSFADRGTVVSRSDVLPPQGSVHQETNVGLTLAPGWARASCTGPVTASLLFRQRNSAGAPVAEAGVNATRVAATRFVTFAEQGVGKAGTGVAYANPSATAALVTFTAKDAEGQVLARANRQLLAGGHDAQNMVSLFGLPSFSGSLEITSTEPIVSLSLNFEAAPVFSSLPPGEVDAAAQGTTTYYFPHLAVGASWQTTITYINYSPQQVSCTTDFISDHGSPLLVSFADRGTVVSRSDVLPAGGSVHQETNVDLSAPLAPGWARTTCSGPVTASLLFRQHNSAGVPVAEAGVNATRVAATRFVTFAEQGEGKAGTGVAYANPSATAAHVTFTAQDTEGQLLASVVRTLLPGGHDAQNMAPLFGLPSFSGSLEITSTEPIVSLSLNFEAAPVFSSLPPGETPPGGAQPLDSLVVGKVMVFEVLTSNPPGAPDEIRVEFPSAGRARIVGAGHSGGTYEYVSTGLNTGTLTVATSRDGHGTNAHEHVAIVELTFTTATTGTFTGIIEPAAATGTGNFSIIDP